MQEVQIPTKKTDPSQKIFCTKLQIKFRRKKAFIIKLRKFLRAHEEGD